MKNIFDYLNFYGNSSFKELAFNDVDSLILTQLVYAKLKGCAPLKKGESRRLEDICSLFLAKYSEKDFKKEDYLFPNSYRLVLALQSSKRFMDAFVSNYIEEVASENQFGAMTVRFPDGTCYIAFEGTDSSIIGWKEDLELIYRYPILSQKRAQEYLNQTISFFDRKVYIGGHSKGGNIAMYAYMNAKFSIKRRVIHVYNFDGPGFLDNVLQSKEYLEMKPKLKMFVPEQSVVGMILGHGPYEVVRSRGLGILQHDAFTWCCFGGKFEPGILSKKSSKLEKHLEEYLKQMKDEEKVTFVTTLFAVFEHLNVTNVMQIREIKLSSIIAFIKELRTIPESTKKHLMDAIKMLISGVS